jgi:ATP-binding cassette subfamily B protein
VLDEATSALDSNSEQKIRSALSHLEKGRTVIAVAHRLSTLASYDRIIVLEGGVIVEDGTYDELQNRNGTFHRMWRLQSQMSLETVSGSAA